MQRFVVIVNKLVAEKSLREKHEEASSDLPGFKIGSNVEGNNY